MRLNCIHCGKPFTITSEQLGGRGACPHCQNEIRLPEAADGISEAAAPAEPPERFHWWENSISGLVSLVFHMVLMLVLALVTYGGTGGGGSGEGVLIGDVPSVVLSDGQQEELSTDVAPPSRAAMEADEMLEVQPPVNLSSASTTDEPLAVASPSLSGGESGSFDLGTVSIGGGGGGAGGGNWDGLVQSLRRQGLDIVVCFDSTGSMGGEIREVKEQIRRIGDILIRLIPKARISICTYRDEGDEYVVKGLPLSNDIQEVARYLADIEADAGGDRPESVHEGLRWSVTKNVFRDNARKVILLFGDAPPHSGDLDECLAIASDFARQQKGIVSTVTCRSPIRLPEFVDIAQMGGGEAFLTTEERQIITQLLVLVFGSQYRDKVLEAFKLMER